MRLVMRRSRAWLMAGCLAVLVASVCSEVRAGKVLFVGDFDGDGLGDEVEDMGSDAAIITLIESFGHTVDTIDRNDPSLTIALTDQYHVLWNSPTSSSGSIRGNDGLESAPDAEDGATNLVTMSTAAIINMEHGSAVDFGFHNLIGGIFNAGQSAVPGLTSLDVPDDTHAIFDGLTGPTIQIYNNPGELRLHGTDSVAISFFGIPAFVTDAEQLAYLKDVTVPFPVADGTGIVVMPRDGSMFANTIGEGGTAAPNYRIGFPLGFGAATVGVLTADGETLVENVLRFAIGLPGDVNHDNTVDQDDLDVIDMNWGQMGVGLAGGDWNLDGVVDGLDANEVSAHWMETYPTSGLISPIPEPSSVVLALCGALMLGAAGGFRRRGAHGDSDCT